MFTGDLGEPLRPDSIGQAFRRLVLSSDVPVIRLHDLRHTHASHLLRAGVNVKVVSDRLGHRLPAARPGDQDRRSSDGAAVSRRAAW